MNELDCMIERLKWRVEEESSIFTKQEVAFLLRFLQQHQSDTKAISLNSSSSSQGGEHHG